MDARLTQACALVQAKPRTLDEIALALKTTRQLGSMLVGRLIAAGVLARDGEKVSVVDAARAKAIAAGEVASLPMRKRKKRKAKTNGEAPPPRIDRPGRRCHRLLRQGRGRLPDDRAPRRRGTADAGRAGRAAALARVRAHELRRALIA